MPQTSTPSQHTWPGLAQRKRIAAARREAAAAKLRAEAAELDRRWREYQAARDARKVAS